MRHLLSRTASLRPVSVRPHSHHPPPAPPTGTHGASPDLSMTIVFGSDDRPRISPDRGEGRGRGGIMANWRRALAIVGALAIVAAALLAPAGPARAADGFTQGTVEASRTGDRKGGADIDGDGVGDGFVGRSTLTWYHSPGGALTGTWVAHDIAKAAVEYTTQCAPADINRDGAPDIVVPDTSNSAGNLIWYENPRGHGGNPATDAWARRIIGSPTYWLHDVAIADLDGDGRPDVVTRSTTDDFDIVDIWTQGAPDAGGVPT